MTNTRDSIAGRADERGSALIGVLLLLMMMSALVAALCVSGQTETLISRNQRSGAQAQAAAEAGLNHAVELATTYISQWKANGYGSAGNAIDFLLMGPDVSFGDPLLDADNGSLGTLAGIDEAEGIPIPPARLEVAPGMNATYTAFLMDDPGAPGEDADAFHDSNQRLIVQATGYGPDNTVVVLQAVISPIPLLAVVTDGNLNILDNVAIGGSWGSVHANGDLVISGAPTVLGSAKASGDRVAPVGIDGYGGAARHAVFEIRAIDYRVHADYVLTSAGNMTDLVGTPICAAPCDNWDFDGTTWSIGSAAPPDGRTYYVEGPVTIAGDLGGGPSPVHISIIAEGSIDISGNPRIRAAGSEILFVTDADLRISGGLDTFDPLLPATSAGRILVHEQINLSGTPNLLTPIVVENGANDDGLVSANEISGNVTLTYNGDLGGDVYKVSGWRDIRQP